MLEKPKIVGRINGKKIYYDGFEYYIRIKGRNFVIDYKGDKAC